MHGAERAGAEAADFEDADAVEYFAHGCLLFFLIC